MHSKYAPDQQILKASSYYLEEVKGLDLSERAKEGKLSFLLLNQPPYCDAHCRRCFMPKERRFLGSRDALTLDESKYVMDKAREYGALCMEISGEGEPTLSKNLPGIIEHANDIGLLTTLITNGHNLTKDQIDMYHDSNVTMIFSHFSLNKETYEMDNNTPGSFDRKMRNLEHAVQVYSDKIVRENDKAVFSLAIHATLQKDNQKDILNLRHYCIDNDIFFSVAPLAQAGCAVDNPDMALLKQIWIGKELVVADGVSHMLGSNSIIHSHSSEKDLGREVCGTCFYGLNVGFDGAILLDAHTGYEIGDKNLMGNIRTVDFDEVLQRRSKAVKLMFENLDGFCPVRDPKWDSLLKKIVNEEIKI